MMKRKITALSIILVLLLAFPAAGWAIDYSENPDDFDPLMNSYWEFSVYANFFDEHPMYTGFIRVGGALYPKTDGRGLIADIINHSYCSEGASQFDIPCGGCMYASNAPQVQDEFSMNEYSFFCTTWSPTLDNWKTWVFDIVSSGSDPFSYPEATIENAWGFAQNLGPNHTDTTMYTLRGQGISYY